MCLQVSLELFCLCIKELAFILLAHCSLVLPLITTFCVQTCHIFQPSVPPDSEFLAKCAHAAVDDLTTPPSAVTSQGQLTYTASSRALVEENVSTANVETCELDSDDDEEDDGLVPMFIPKEIPFSKVCFKFFHRIFLPFRI